MPPFSFGMCLQASFNAGPAASWMTLSNPPPPVSLGWAGFTRKSTFADVYLPCFSRTIVECPTDKTAEFL